MCPPGAATYESCSYTIGYESCYQNGGQAVISCLMRTSKHTRVNYIYFLVSIQGLQ